MILGDGYPSRIRLGRDDAVVFLLLWLRRRSAGGGADAMAVPGTGDLGAGATFGRPLSTQGGAPHSWFIHVYTP